METLDDLLSSQKIDGLRNKLTHQKQIETNTNKNKILANRTVNLGPKKSKIVSEMDSIMDSSYLDTPDNDTSTTYNNPYDRAILEDEPDIRESDEFKTFIAHEDSHRDITVRESGNRGYSDEYSEVIDNTDYEIGYAPGGIKEDMNYKMPSWYNRNGYDPEPTMEDINLEYNDVIEGQGEIAGEDIPIPNQHRNSKLNIKSTLKKFNIDAQDYIEGKSLEEEEQYHIPETQDNERAYTQPQNTRRMDFDIQDTMEAKQVDDNDYLSDIAMPTRDAERIVDKDIPTKPKQPSQQTRVVSINNLEEKIESIHQKLANLDYDREDLITINDDTTDNKELSKTISEAFATIKEKHHSANTTQNQQDKPDIHPPKTIDIAKADTEEDIYEAISGDMPIINIINSGSDTDPSDFYEDTYAPEQNQQQEHQQVLIEDLPSIINDNSYDYVNQTIEEVTDEVISESTNEDTEPIASTDNENEDILVSNTTDKEPNEPTKPEEQQSNLDINNLDMEVNEDDIDIASMDSIQEESYIAGTDIDSYLCKKNNYSLAAENIIDKTLEVSSKLKAKNYKMQTILNKAVIFDNSTIPLQEALNVFSNLLKEIKAMDSINMDEIDMELTLRDKNGKLLVGIVDTQDFI